MSEFYIEIKPCKCQKLYKIENGVKYYIRDIDYCDKHREHREMLNEILKKVHEEHGGNQND